MLALLLAIPCYGVPVTASEHDRLASNRLAGTQWVLVSFVEGTTESALPQGTNSTLKFSAGEPPLASGHAGCNWYHGSYRVERDRLSFGPIATTRMACLSEATAQHEPRYLRALETAGVFEVTPGRLTISYGEGRGVLVFRRA
ncbi:uncharacterized protein SOCEGT47_082680 [Sorangium cellulosum]|uniref:DUF306 domain-containing protein n=2 Tax=Polyangiaceae TaxID=49 RepID=A0A4P2QD32_SORCE|nr:uncharacterized protein SOCEGT47_082680 [Sorangium cellulosum]